MIVATVSATCPSLRFPQVSGFASSVLPYDTSLSNVHHSNRILSQGSPRSRAGQPVARSVAIRSEISCETVIPRCATNDGKSLASRAL